MARRGTKQPENISNSLSNENIFPDNIKDNPPRNMIRFTNNTGTQQSTRATSKEKPVRRSVHNDVCFFIINPVSSTKQPNRQDKYSFDTNSLVIL